MTGRTVISRQPEQSFHDSCGDTAVYMQRHLHTDQMIEMIRKQQQQHLVRVLGRRLKSSSGLKPQQQHSSPFLRQPGVILGFSMN